jgi:hypothetical protein
MGRMTFERESVTPISDPSAKRVASEIRKLKSYGKSSFASLTREDGSYVQVAGGGVGCMVEKRDAAAQRQFRAFRRNPTVSFEDGTELVFGGGRIALRRDEWLNSNMVAEIFVAFLEDRPFPSEIDWRDMSAILGRP